MTEQRQRESTVTLRLRKGLHEVREEGDVDRFILSDNPDDTAPTSIRVRYGDDGLPSTVEIERRAESYFPVYFCVPNSEEVVVADTMGFMHDVARRAEVELRTTAQLDHLVFGRSPETGLLSGIEVVDHGERVTLEQVGGRWTLASRQRFDRFEQYCESPWRDRLGEMSARLERAVDAISPASILFSGGVDSTLLRSMLDDDVEMTSGRVPDEAFLPEVEQAARAAALFDGVHRYVDVDHEEYLDDLVDVTQRTGLPCPAMQHVLQTRVAARAKSPVVYGELGDGMFGLPLVENPGLRGWVDGVEATMAGAASRVFSLASMRDEDDCFAEDMDEVYGPVDATHRRRSHRIRELVTWPDELRRRSGNWRRFLGYGHLIDYLTVGCVKCVRDFASSRGVIVHTPLTDRSLIDHFHRCDPATRYCDGGRTKPVPKTLLSNQLPDYPVDRPKLASGLPRTWYFTEGPLVDVFDRFPPPSPMAKAVQRAIEEPRWENSWILWPTLSYAVWYHAWLGSESVPERRDLVVHMLGDSSREMIRAAS